MRRHVALIATLVVAAGLAGPVAARASDAPPRPIVVPLRDDEDWQGLRAPSARVAPLDHLKYVPLGPSPYQYLTLSGEVREWYERYSNADWNPANGTTAYLLQRYLGGIDVRSFRFRTFVQLESATAGGRKGGSGPLVRDDADVTDAYLAWRFGPLAGPAPLWAIVGRQELDYGAGRVIAARDGATVRQAFDGARLVGRTGSWRIDAFAVRPVKVAPGAFDDTPDAAQALSGVYARRGTPGGPGLDLYAIAAFRGAAVYGRGAGPETRYTVGSRYAFARGRWSGDLEASYQTGSFGAGARSATIAASSVAGSIAYALGGKIVATSLSLGAGTASGDADPRSRVLRTYVPPSFRGTYLGLVQEDGPANSQGFEPAAAFTYRGTTLSVGDAILRVAQPSDAVYNLAGFPLRQGGGSARALGGGMVAWLTSKVDRYLTVTAGYQRFDAGAHLRETGPAAPLTYDRFELDYKF